MRNLNGVDATRRIRELHPRIRVIGVSVHSGAHHVLAMLQAGASGYVLKRATHHELCRAIETVAHGGSYLSTHLAESEPSGDRGEPLHASALRPREREVLQLLAEGHTSVSSASRTGISFHTVETHRRNIMRKLDLHSVAELTRYALREGITTLE